MPEANLDTTTFQDAPLETGMDSVCPSNDTGFYTIRPLLVWAHDDVNVCFSKFVQIEEEKERRRQAKKAERVQKRKKEKEVASKETEPKAKRARQVSGEKH